MFERAPTTQGKTSVLSHRIVIRGEITTALVFPHSAAGHPTSSTAKFNSMRAANRTQPTLKVHDDPTTFEVAGDWILIVLSTKPSAAYRLGLPVAHNPRSLHPVVHNLQLARKCRCPPIAKCDLIRCAGDHTPPAENGQYSCPRRISPRDASTHAEIMLPQSTASTPSAGNQMR